MYRFASLGKQLDYIYGINPVMSALNAGRRELHELYVNETQQSDTLNPRVANILNRAQQLKLPIKMMPRKKLEKFCGFDQPHQNVILKCTPLNYSTTLNGQCLVVLDQITDPQNFGAILRTCFFLGINTAIVDKKNTCQLTPTVSKTSSGAVEMMDVYKTDDLIGLIQDLKRDHRIIGTGVGKNSVPLSSVNGLSTKGVVIFGSESMGVQHQLLRLCDTIINIPSQRTEFPETLVDSLNVAIVIQMTDNKLQIPEPKSLVKYANAVLVSTSGKPVKDKKKGRDAAPQALTNAHTEDILNSILPPREYTMEKQQLWIQCVSPTPATRADVLQLQEKLEKALQERQARETGICPIREELYAQCFDELIRQITINCAERGLLLVRVRDEIRLTIQAYQTLYESSIAFGMRKALQAEQRKSEMLGKIKSLEGDSTDLQKQVEAIEKKIEDMQKQDNEQQENDERVHREQVNFLKNANKVYKEELEKFLTGANVKK